jgi:DNA repair exonuclease SbcCD ATPase subunit
MDEYRPYNPPPAEGAAPSGFAAAKIPLLFGAFLALLASSIFSLLQIAQLRKDVYQLREEAAKDRRSVADAREQVLGELAQFRENSTASTLKSRSTIDSLKAEIDATRKQARNVLGDAQKDANRKVAELEAALVKAQNEQAQKVAAVSEAVTQVRSDAEVTRANVGAVSKDLSDVKTSVTATKSELEKTIETLRSARGDLGIQSGLIATNANELAALRAQGERNYTEFKLMQKDKGVLRVGDLRLRLKSADVKKNRFTLAVIVDDKEIERKDKTVNEPLQFLLAGSQVPYEIVVNEVRKDMVSGYVSEPKVKQGKK